MPSKFWKYIDFTALSKRKKKKSKKRAAFAKHLLLFFAYSTLIGASFTMAGCGVDGNSNAAAVHQEMSAGTDLNAADIKIKTGSLDKSITAFDVMLFYNSGKIFRTQRFLPAEFRKGAVSLSGVPDSVGYAVLKTEDRYRNIALTDSVALKPEPGSTIIINTPEFFSGAELEERLSDLKTDASVLKIDTGKMAQINVKGIFLCKNSGIEIECDLTRNARLVYSVQNNSLLRHKGSGLFKGRFGGSTSVFISFGKTQIELPVIIKAVSGSQPAVEEDSDPAASEDPVPVDVETPKSLTLDLRAAGFPEDATVEYRAYDSNKQLRAINKNASLYETMSDVDESVTTIAGVVLERDSQVCGIVLKTDVDLAARNSYSADDLQIISGPELAARGEMILSSDKTVYDVNQDAVYVNTDKNKRCIMVKCSAYVQYTVVPGYWLYNSTGKFLEERCVFDASGSDVEDYGVFRFLDKPGVYSVSVTYRDITGVFTVTITDPMHPLNYSLNFDLTNLGIPAGATLEIRGYGEGSSPVWQESDITDLSPGFDEVTAQVKRVVGVVRSANGEPFGRFEKAVVLNSEGKVETIKPQLVTGESFVKQYGALTFDISAKTYDLKDVSSYLSCYTNPALKFTYANGWTQSFSGYAIKAWEDFNLSTSPHLDYLLNGYKYILKIVNTGSYTVYAQYKGLKSSSVTINVVNSAPVPGTVYLTFASSGLPGDASTVLAQFYKNGAPITQEYSKEKAASLSFSDISQETDYVTLFAKNSDGQIVGIGGRSISFSNNKADLGSVSLATGAAMDSYITSLTASPAGIVKSVGAYLSASVQAQFSFNYGKISTSRNVSTEVVYSSDDMTAGSLGYLWRVNRAGESTLTAKLGTKTADIHVYASGEHDNTKYQYAQLPLDSKRSAVVVINPGSETIALNGTVIGGTPDDTSSLMADASSDSQEPVILLDLPHQLTEPDLDSEITEKNSKLFDSSDNESTIDYVNPKVGDVIPNLIGMNYNDQPYTFDAEVLVSNSENASCIMLAELVDGKPVVDREKALKLDAVLGTKNPMDQDQMGVLPRVRSVFGCENGYKTDGGMDKTKKIIVIFLDGKKLSDGLFSTLGYFYSVDTYRRSVSSRSNEGDIIYANSNAKDEFELADTLSHEFQHMCHHNQAYWHDGARTGSSSARNEKMINESFAMLASVICGFGIDGKQVGDHKYNSHSNLFRVSTYFENMNGSSIKGWSEGTTHKYGKALVFSSFLLDKFGTGVFPKYFASFDNYSHSNPVDPYEALAAACGQSSFADLYRDFALACLLSGSNVSGSIPDKYKLQTIVPGSKHRYNPDYNSAETISNIALKTLSADYNESLKPCSCNIYLTPNMSYAVSGTSSVFGVWSDPLNIIKFLQFDSTLKYESGL